MYNFKSVSISFRPYNQTLREQTYNTLLQPVSQIAKEASARRLITILCKLYSPLASIKFKGEKGILFGIHFIFLNSISKYSVVYIYRAKIVLTTMFLDIHMYVFIS